VIIRWCPVGYDITMNDPLDPATQYSNVMRIKFNFMLRSTGQLLRNLEQRSAEFQMRMAATEAKEREWRERRRRLND
jgi:hypothetical protein